ncbi:MAG: class I SAM-dependent methyltransferase, partial [Gammaproteobacteria bacterium]|nr:class I SAM-dependent methyltransferase [Gammaproteobacteria bacterium]
ELVNRFDEMIEDLRQSPVAVNTAAANEQHYEVPAEFFEQVLGPRMKYSACLWGTGTTDLAAAEEAMLAVTCERAEIRDGDTILELGCGWGSLTLWMAEHYPASQITAMCNSRSQLQYVQRQAMDRGLQNVEVMHADMCDFDPAKKFDRVVSVEMFEHMRNYQELMRRISGWLHDDGILFVHVFCHDKVMYPFELKSHTDWITRYYFSGGLMPAFRTLTEFQDDLELERSWAMPGTHYERTLNAWLESQDRAADTIMPIFASTYTPAKAKLWFQRWRMFFMSCAELFGFGDGKQWYIAHYRFRKSG